MTDQYPPQQPPYEQQQPYGQAPGQPYGQPYGQAPYGAQGAEYPQAQTVFILGIVGIFVGICAFIAWYMGSQAKKQIEGGAPYVWGGNLKTGYTLGKVFGIIYICVAALYFVLILVGVLAAAAS